MYKLAERSYRDSFNEDHYSVHLYRFQLDRRVSEPPETQADATIRQGFDRQGNTIAVRTMIAYDCSVAIGLKQTETFKTLEQAEFHLMEAEFKANNPTASL